MGSEKRSNPTLDQFFGDDSASLSLLLNHPVC